MPTQVEHLTNQPTLKPLWGIPWWYHHHGLKMRVLPEPPVRQSLHVYITGSEADIKIEPFLEDGYENYWNVTWHLQFSLFEHASGNCIFTKEQLEAAFGLRDTYTDPLNTEISNSMIKQYGGTIAYQGKFIRWDLYLTIPAPCMGHDGAPAVSVLLDPQIMHSIENVITNRKA